MKREFGFDGRGRRAESMAVKRALQVQGITATVGHGRKPSLWDYLVVRIQSPVTGDPRTDARIAARTVRTIRQVTGRSKKFKVII